MSLQIIAIGLPRTGTLSLKAALEMLGYGKCYHMVQLLGNPSDIHFWEGLSEGKSVNMASFFENYQSITDFPASSYYKELLAEFPDVKVISTVRDKESWFHSFNQTLVQGSLKAMVRNKALFEKTTGKKHDLLRVFKFVHDELLIKQFDDTFEDKDQIFSLFDQHYTEIRELIPAPNLLEFSVKEGWAPLCTFLGKPMPNVPFPRLNDRATFTGRLEKLREMVEGE